MADPSKVACAGSASVDTRGGCQDICTFIRARGAREGEMSKEGTEVKEGTVDEQGTEGWERTVYGGGGGERRKRRGRRCRRTGHRGGRR